MPQLRFQHFMLLQCTVSCALRHFHLRQVLQILSASTEVSFIDLVGFDQRQIADLTNV